ncbi:hypothetical protein AQUCO_12300028v1 [Aquilegia coerulea]|uniref:Uncharacterized protein n=1 Tax=Aquilegia coerulea TaxID=218851 RepID=A0A2G5C1N8_AQUCA|nr:hypothetical protein AQUCO_12300028v1 [Aquilegia coerulea]
MVPVNLQPSYPTHSREPKRAWVHYVLTLLIQVALTSEVRATPIISYKNRTTCPKLNTCGVRDPLAVL